MEAKPAGKFRPMLFKLAIMFGALSACLLVLELGVRVLGLASAPSDAGGESIQHVVQFDSKLETRYKPGARTTIKSQYGEFEVEYVFNELGLRDRPLNGSESEAPRRILALGNSFVEGWGLPAQDTFLRVAENRLNGGDAERSVRIVNAGASGYGAAQCYLLMQDLMPRVRPDAVVFFYVGTMMVADHRFVSRANLDEQGLATGLDVRALLQGPTHSGGSSSQESSPSFLTRHSHLVRLIATRMANAESMTNLIPGDPTTDLLAPYRMPSSQRDSLHEATWRHIAAMARMAEEAGAPFLVVHLPMPFEVSPVEWSRGKEIYDVADKTVQSDDIAVATKAALDAAGIPWVSAYDLLAEKTAQQEGDPRLYFDTDFHLNKSGARAVGHWLAKQLQMSLMGGEIALHPDATTPR